MCNAQTALVGDILAKSEATAAVCTGSDFYAVELSESLSARLG